MLMLMMMLIINYGDDDDDDDDDVLAGPWVSTVSGVSRVTTRRQCEFP